jgi:hypothetical protein
MVRGLRWLGIVALVAAPVVAWLGRPKKYGCEPPIHGPCDPLWLSATWEMPATVTLVVVGVALLLIAWFAARQQRSEHRAE